MHWLARFNMIPSVQMKERAEYLIRSSQAVLVDAGRTVAESRQRIIALRRYRQKMGL
ncbi:MAG TPA: hypothetical protein VJV04_07075 [Nitrospiraceae bacterium]|nr:hypothetical protein [Nitrospiraceae bacterium]